jgi:hypothetical protein
LILPDGKKVTPAAVAQRDLAYPWNSRENLPAVTRSGLGDRADADLG